MTSEHGFLLRQENKRTWFWKDMRTREHDFWERHENRRTGFLGEDMRTREHGFWEDMRTREHEKKGKGLLEQNENKRFWLGFAQHSFLAVYSLKLLDFSLFTLHSSLNNWILHFSLFTLHL